MHFSSRCSPSSVCGAVTSRVASWKRLLYTVETLAYFRVHVPVKGDCTGWRTAREGGVLYAKVEGWPRLRSSQTSSCERAWARSCNFGFLLRAPKLPAPTSTDTSHSQMGHSIRRMRSIKRSEGLQRAQPPTARALGDFLKQPQTPSRSNMLRYVLREYREQPLDRGSSPSQIRQRQFRDLLAHQVYLVVHAWRLVLVAVAAGIAETAAAHHWLRVTLCHGDMKRKAPQT